MKQRKKSRHKKDTNKKKLNIKFTAKQRKVLAVVIAVFLLFVIVYGRPIIKLRVEQAQLKKQNEQLLEEKSAKSKELKNVHSKDYIQEQARKQLRLLNKDETLFLFEEDNED